MASRPAPYVRLAGQDWLLSCADTPAEIRALWDADELGNFPSGGHWIVGETYPARTMQAVKGIPAQRRGLVLADCHQGIAWWLLPPALTDELDDVHALTVRPRGWILHCPPALYPVRGECGSNARTAQADSPTLYCSAMHSAPAAGPTSFGGMRMTLTSTEASEAALLELRGARLIESATTEPELAAAQALVDERTILSHRSVHRALGLLDLPSEATVEREGLVGRVYTLGLDHEERVFVGLTPSMGIGNVPLSAVSDLGERRLAIILRAITQLAGNDNLAVGRRI
ncbi:hypothetical protein [Streptomyces sp. NPDC001422]|uniref:hypothetical protein n=1 Tax=Streptomyces sp. NPDC001422 TaxID=3364575 RepID=UPI0036B6A112